MSDLEVEEFLEHYGIKGMQWGVRNDKKKSNDGGKAKNQKKRKKLTPAQKRKIKAYTKIGIGLTIYSAVTISSIMSLRGSSPAKSTKVRNKASVQDIINNERHKQADSLKRMFKEGHMDSNQYKNFSETLQKRYDRKIAESIL